MSPKGNRVKIYNLFRHSVFYTCCKGADRAEQNKTKHTGTENPNNNSIYNNKRIKKEKRQKNTNKQNNERQEKRIREEKMNRNKNMKRKKERNVTHIEK